MAYNDILNELRSKLEGDYAEKMNFLRTEGDRFAKENNLDGVKAVGELVKELMPPEQREEVERLTHMDGMTLHEVYEKIVDMINNNQLTDAKVLAQKLYKKIIVDFTESEKSVFRSLRNPFEDALFHAVCKPDKIVNRAPFDFGTYLTTYAYILVETGATIDAIPVLEKAIEYNPVDCGPKFELAEIHKITRNRKMVTNLTRETLKVASSPVAIARCYANMGYALTDAQEYEDAFVFYVASSMFAPNQAVVYEMNHLRDLMGKPLVKPSQEKIIEVMKKYDIEFGPDKEVISIAAQLASDYMIKQDIPNAVQALKLTYNLTLDEDIKNLILKYDPKAPMLFPENNGEKTAPDITVTRNDNN